MRTRISALVVAVLIIIVIGGGVAWYYTTLPGAIQTSTPTAVDFGLKSANYDPDMNDATKWVVTKWNAHDSSWGKIEDSKFKLYFKPIKLDEWGNVAITQGNQAHCPIKNSIPLKEKFIIRREGDDVCLVKFKAMRHEFTLIKSSGICQIGITIYLDVGLDFCSPDITQPHALPIDFIFAKFEDGKIVSSGEVHWQANPYENDYHSAFIIGQMPNPDVDYSFQVRIDDLIRKSLGYWGFDRAEVKGVHAWLEGKNSEGSCEIDYVELKVNEKIDTYALNEGQIVNFGYQSIRFKPGDSVEAWAIIQNNLDNITIFYVGFSVKDQCNIWFDAPYVAVVLPPKAVSDTILLSWKIPSDAVLGFYAVRVAVWKGTIAGMLSERLDYREHSHAFLVTRELPPLAFIVNFSFSILPNIVSNFLRKDRKTAYKRLGHYGILCVGYAIFILTLPNVPHGLKVIGYCFEAWGILTILIGLNFSSLVDNLSKNVKDLILWIFDYKNPASFQMAILTYYFLLPTFSPPETLPLSPNILAISCLLFLSVFNSTTMFRMLQKIIVIRKV